MPKKLAVRQEENSLSPVTQEEFTAFKNDILDALRAKDALVGSSRKNETVPVVADLDTTEQELQPQYRKIFEKYFDPKDGFKASMTFPELDDKGRESGGLLFTIIVPPKFSNADEAHRKMYPVDIRLKALSAGNIAKGIDDYCKLVAQNLHYNRNVVVK